jgi:hypothetical protein
MKRIRNSWLITGAALLFLAPSALALQNAHPANKNNDVCRFDRRCKVAADEGGSAAMYLVLAGLTCTGAVFVSSRRRNPADKAV